MKSRLTQAAASSALAIGLASSALFSVALAQDEEAANTDPRPAEIMPRAPFELLLDVRPRGEAGYVAVGARGHILLSADGTDWKQVPSPVRANLNAVEFVDDSHGWAVGHAATILHTSDGGQTWNVQHFDPELETPFLDVAFLDRDRGFAVGAYDLFYVTDDGGQTWDEYPEPLSAGEWHLNSIARLGNGDLVIAGETGLLTRSQDGGETWELIEGPYTGTYFGIKAMGETGAILYGLRGHAFVTNDLTTARVLPPDTDLGYQFKKPPTMTDDNEGSDGSDAEDPEQEAAEKVVEESTEKKKEALAEAERKQAEEQAKQTAWEVVDNEPSVLSLLGATTTRDGGYVIVGINGVIWGSDDSSAEVEQLPNSREGGLTAVTERPDGNLIMVGEAGAFLYKRP